MSDEHTGRSRPSTGRTGLGRRNLLRAAVVAGGLAAAGGGAGIARAQSFAHPGMLHTQADLDRMRAKVNAGAQPWKAGWDRLVANRHSQVGWTPRPVEEIVRGNTDKPQNYHLLYGDIAAAYQNALRWRITGDTAHGDTARDICNAWSQTLKSIYWPPSDSRLASGIYGYQFANVGELMRGYPGFDLGRFQQMMNTVFYPLNSDFLVRHNNTCDSHYWANWDLCNMASIMAIGILRNDRAQIDEVVNYFWNGVGNGAIDNAIPFVHGDLAQWQESGRDQAHSMMGVGLMATFMEMAWNQGIDLYSARDNRFAKAAEYVARYNLGHSVPYTRYRNCSGADQTVISEHARGQARPVWEMVYHHYYSRRGMAMPNVARMAGQNSPEGGGGDYGGSSGGFDALGFGTLAHVRERTPATLNRLQSYNFQDRYVRHINFGVRLDAVINPAADAQFRLVPGLAASGGVSFEAANQPGHYLRHYGFEARLDPNRGSSTFAADATFHRVAGLADGSWSSFRSHNYPDRHLRHYSYQLRLDPITDPTGRADATFRITS
jgi:hypothetical protein